MSDIQEESSKVEESVVNKKSESQQIVLNYSNDESDAEDDNDSDESSDTEQLPMTISPSTNNNPSTMPKSKS